MNEVIQWYGAESLRQFLVPVDSLEPFPDNPMRDEHHVYFIAKSLRDFGQVRAVLTWANAEEHGLPANTIVGGHHVWRAATTDDLKWTHIAAIPAEFSSRTHAQDYLVLDNIASLRDAEQAAAQLSLTDNPEYAEHVRGIMEYARTAVSVSELKLHEQSVRKSPEEVIEHLAANLRAVGFTDEEVVIARDGTILAGEDVMRAAALAGLDKIPAKRMDINPDSLEARQIMARHYAVGKRAMVDERAYADLLKQIQDEAGSLEGTGYDPEMLQLLILQSRPATEIRDINEAAEWIGLAEYKPVELPVKHVISFEDEEMRDRFFEQANAAGLNLGTIKRTLGTTSGWWPHRERQDPGSLRFVDSGREKPKPAVKDEFIFTDAGALHVALDEDDNIVDES